MWLSFLLVFNWSFTLTYYYCLSNISLFPWCNSLLKALYLITCLMVFKLIIPPSCFGYCSNNFKHLWKPSIQQSLITYAVLSRTHWIDRKSLRIWASYINYAAGSVRSKFLCFFMLDLVSYRKNRDWLLFFFRF